MGALAVVTNDSVESESPIAAELKTEFCSATEVVRSETALAEGCVDKRGKADGISPRQLISKKLYGLPLTALTFLATEYLYR